MKKYLPLLLLFLVPSSTMPKLDQKKSSSYDTWLQTFGEVITLFEERYYKEIDPEKAMIEALKGYTALDPHTTFMDTKLCTDLKRKIEEEFYGTGMVLPGELKKDEEFFPVLEIIPGGPADKAGVKAGDKVMQIDDTIVKGLDIDEIMSKLKGEKNTKVTLKIMRALYPETLTLEITRDVVKDEMTLAYYLPDYNVYYLLLSIFGEKSADHVEKILKKSIEKECKGLILDLRNNTGGLFDSAIKMASLFLPKGTPIVSTKERNGKVTGAWKASGKTYKIPASMPIFILVNNYTASASEIFAGVLQLYGLHKNLLPVFIIGDETFGKGSVQEVIPINSTSAVKLTTALYHLPFNTIIQGEGIEPDFHVEHRTLPSETMKWVTSNYGKENALKGSINPNDPEDKNSKSKKQKKQEDKTKTWKEQRREFVAEDYLIKNTLTLLELYNLGYTQNPLYFEKRENSLSFLKKHYAIDAKVEVQDIKL